MATPNYDINYDDKRFTEVETDKNKALEESDGMYDGMIKNTDKFYTDQKNAVDDYAKTQTDLQNKQSELAIDRLEQQQEWARQDYLKEQSGAYTDWQKQSNQYGVNAEQMAANGMTNTGYSESSQVSMYNQYQNRVATARESFLRASTEYDMAIKDAQLQNSSILAEIAANALEKKLEISLAGFQYKNTLLTAKADARTKIDQNYYERYLAVLDQINTENQLKESVRQHTVEMDFKERTHAEEMDFQKKSHEAEMAYKNAALAEEKRQFNATLDWQKEQAANKSSSGGSINKSSSSGTKYGTSEAKVTYIKPTGGSKTTNVETGDAYTYLNKLIASGATKDKVSNEIAIALREGAITKAEATKLRNTFTPRGLAY